MSMLRYESGRSPYCRPKSPVVVECPLVGIGEFSFAVTPAMQTRGLRVKLPLRGLESLKLKFKTNTDTDAEADATSELACAVLSHSDFAQSATHDGAAVAPDDSLFPRIKAVDADGNVCNGLPPEGGGFEVNVPFKLVSSAASIAVHWVDFFR
jgi:hypothetical protein